MTLETSSSRNIHYSFFLRCHAFSNGDEHKGWMIFLFFFFFFFGTNAPSPSYPSLLLYHASVSTYQDPSTEPTSISNSPRVTFEYRAKRSQEKCEFRATVDGTVETHQKIWCVEGRGEETWPKKTKCASFWGYVCQEEPSVAVSTEENRTREPWKVAA